MELEAWSLVLTVIGVLLGVVGIIVSVYCWRHTAKELKALRELKKSCILQEFGMLNFAEQVRKYLKENPDAVNPFTFTGNFNEETIKATLFNLEKYALNKED